MVSERPEGGDFPGQRMVFAQVDVERLDKMITKCNFCITHNTCNIGIQFQNGRKRPHCKLVMSFIFGQDDLGWKLVLSTFQHFRCITCDPHARLETNFACQLVFTLHWSHERSAHASSNLFRSQKLDLLDMKNLSYVCTHTSIMVWPVLQTVQHNCMLNRIQSFLIFWSSRIFLDARPEKSQTACSLIAMIGRKSYCTGVRL